MIKSIIKKMLYREKYNSNTYHAYLRRNGVRLAENVWFVSPRKITIDLTRPYLIEIGENVVITEGVTILTHGFDWSVLKVKYGEVLGSAGKVKIGDNVFIGVNTTILKGVSIGDNVIIGANSVVTKGIPNNCVAAGNPCRVIMGLDEYYIKRRKQQYNEAKELIKEYYDVYGVLPTEDDLDEFFWLFHDRDESIINRRFITKMNYGGNYDFSYKAFKSTKAIARNFNEFINKCLDNERI